VAYIAENKRAKYIRLAIVEEGKKIFAAVAYIKELIWDSR
jgi:hypothetical protein